MTAISVAESHVRRAILDKYVRVSEDARIGWDIESDRRYHHVTEGGIVVVEKGAIVRSSRDESKQNNP
jgi:ADP-glucose pyrophosphorylase